ncbi:MAG: AlpA family phage regulatory protein [Chloroflexota bacterium]|nr:AlpA family phage regulatory protein [Chloroflexota bacterium]
MPEETPPERNTDPIVLRPPQVADLLSVSRSTLHRMVKEGRFPAPRYIGPASPRWTRQTVENWVETHIGQAP